MRKLNEYTRDYVEVEEVGTVFRTGDGVAYGIYKDKDNRYYIDAYDGAYSIAEFSGEFKNDADVVKSAKQYIDELDN